ncbi:MAG: TlpA disulfide reductase family protein [Marinifilaceae bacterium]
MKKKLNLILIIISVVIMSSCDNSQKGITTYVSNTTQNINITKFHNIGTLEMSKMDLKIENNKSIQDTNKSGEIMQAFIMVNQTNHSVFLPADKNINIQIDNKELIFNEDDYVNKFSQQFFKEIVALMHKGNVTNEIIKEIDLEKTNQLDKLNLIKGKVSKNEYNLLHGIIIGKIAHLKFMFSKKLKADDLKAEYYDFVDSITLDNDQFLKFTDNVNTIFEMLKVKYYREYGKAFDSSEIKVEYINKIIKNRELASAFTCLFMSNIIPDLSKKEKEKIIVKMKKLKLKEKYINHVINVNPATSLGKVVGNKAEFLESLVSYDKKFSLEQLKGKTVYVDNWATWCGACVNGIGHFNSKYKQIKDKKDVIFIFVSFDRDETIWRNFIEKKSFKQDNIIHLFDSKGMESKYALYYGVRALPTSFVIDKNLKIKNITPPIFEDKDFVSFINKM